LFVSRFKQIVLILTTGIGLGILVPVLMQKLPMNDVANANMLAENSNFNQDKVIKPQQGAYFARVLEGKLSIIQGGPQSGQILLSGLDIRHWPQDMQSMITQIEFHSLDEVQSFIDSMSEELWLE
jgi:hypothetical protein